jgi:hypothetical protein
MHDQSPLWSFEEIETNEPARADWLRTAPNSAQLALAVLAKFEESLASNQVRVGMEQSGSNAQDLRVTLQFHVGEELSDQFLNANSGYRAQFRRDWLRGLAYNEQLIVGIRSIIARTAPSEFSGRLLTPKFDDVVGRLTSRDEVLTSLVPELSKVWFCAKLINGKGGVLQLPSGAVGPHLRLDETTRWASISRNDADSWIDIKGAFVGAAGPYQPKSPIERAKKLQEKGEA